MASSQHFYTTSPLLLEMNSKFFIFILLIVIAFSACTQLPATPQQGQEGQQIPAGASVEDIPDSMLAEECAKYPWPPICEMVPHAEGKKLCEKCKQLETTTATTTPSFPQLPTIPQTPTVSSTLAEEDLPAECRGQTWPPSCESIPAPEGKTLCIACTTVEEQILEASLPADQVTVEHLKNKPKFTPNIDRARQDLGTWYTAAERQAAKSLLTRSLPEKIKGLLEPSQPYQTQALDTEIPAIKALGVNTINILIQYDYGNDEYTLIHPEGFTYSEKDAENEIINWIIKSKSNGFAVDLTVITGNPTEEIEGDNLELFLEQTKETRLKWARIAEEYGVEYFTPYSEFEGEYSLIKRGVRLDITPDEDDLACNEWILSQLPEFREVFSGKLRFQAADIPPEGFSMEGYDYYGVSMSTNKSLEEWNAVIDEHFSHMSSIAERDNLNWMVTEFWIHHSCLNTDPDQPGASYCPPHEISETQTNEYYQAILQKYTEFDDPRKQGFIFDAYVFPAQNIKGTPSEETVKEYFELI